MRKRWLSMFIAFLIIFQMGSGIFSMEVFAFDTYEEEIPSTETSISVVEPEETDESEETEERSYVGEESENTGDAGQAETIEAVAGNDIRPFFAPVATEYLVIAAANEESASVTANLTAKGKPTYAFEEITLTIGDVVPAGDNKSRLVMELYSKLNNDYLYECMMEMAGGKAADEFDEISFSFKFDPNSITPDGKNISLVFPSTPIPFDFNGRTVGEISFKETNGIVNVEVTLLKEEIYSKFEVTLFAYIDITISSEDFIDDIPQIGQGSGEVDYRITWTAKPEKNEVDNNEYTVTKKASKVQPPYIDYTIECDAPAKKNLNGSKITDNLGSAGLTLLWFTYYLYDEDGKFITMVTVDDVTSYVENGTFTFTVPNNSDNVGNVRIDMHTMLDGTKYKSLVESNSLSETIKNKATLINNQENGGETIESNEVETPFNMNFFSKNGQRIGNTDTVTWTLQGNTYFTMNYSTEKYGYIVDYISDNEIHKYVDGSVTLNGIPVSVKDITSDIVDIVYGDLTLDNINKLFGADDKAVVYTVNNQSILIIRLGENDVNKPFIVTYKTQFNRADEYSNIVLPNVAKLVLPPDTRYIGSGTGIGEWTFPQVGDASRDINKVPTMNQDIVSKYGISYYFPINI